MQTTRSLHASGVALHFPTTTLRVIFELADDGVESVSHRDVHTFVIVLDARFTTRDELCPRHGYVDPDVVEATQVLLPVVCFDQHPTSHHVVEEPVELLRLRENSFL
jgi:hypothetical protein